MKTKLCPNCNREFSLMYRVKIDQSKNWYFLCKICTEINKEKINFMYMVELGRGSTILN